MAIIFECDNCKIKFRAVAWHNDSGWQKHPDWMESARGPKGTYLDIVCSPKCGEEFERNQMYQASPSEPKPKLEVVREAREV